MVHINDASDGALRAHNEVASKTQEVAQDRSFVVVWRREGDYQAGHQMTPQDVVAVRRITGSANLFQPIILVIDYQS